jgi:peptide/nickel transport system substrate-binding protein
LSAAVNTADPMILRSSAGGPFGGSANGIDALENLVSAGAVSRDGTDALRPQLADTVPSLENGLWRLLPDGRMETTVHIRPGAQWHDGAPFTSADLLFTLQVGQDPEMLAFGGHPGLDLIDGTEAPDANSIVLKWKRVFIDADTAFSTEFALPMPRHLLERTYAERKGNVVQLPYWTDEFVGTGPFKLRDWVKGSHMTLQAFDQYVLGRPKIDEVTVKFISDTNAMVANFLASEIDVNLGRGLSLEQGMQIGGQWREGKMEVGLFNWVVAYPQFIDPSPRILLDVRMRKALMHALDRQEMADVLQGGLTPVGHSIINTRLPQFQSLDSQVVRYEYDPRRAIQIIEGLGYTRGSDGMFRDRANEPLRVEIRTTGEQEIQTKSVLSIADYWQKAGVGVDTMVLGVQRRTDRAYRATRPGFEVLRTPDGQKGLRRAYSSETPLPENNFSKSGNNARYMNPEFDALLDRYFSTIPIQERLQVLGQIVHHSSDQINVMGLFSGAEPTLISNRLIGAGPRGGQDSTNAWNVADWDLRS